MANLRVIAEIKPAGDFPVVDAPNVSVTGGKRLDVALSEAAAEVAKKANKSEVDAALAGKANKSEVDAAIENKADKSAFEAINASVSVNTSNIQELSTESTVLSARMDEFTKLKEGSTTGDAELIDGRIGSDGKTYDNIGGAIRGQVADLKSDLNQLNTDLDVLSAKLYAENFEFDYSDLEVVSNGYIGDNGTIVQSSVHKVVKMSGDKVKKLSGTALQYFTGSVFVVKQGDTVTDYYHLPTNATGYSYSFDNVLTSSDTIYLNWFNFNSRDTINGVTVSYDSIIDNANVHSNKTWSSSKINGIFNETVKSVEYSTLTKVSNGWMSTTGSITANNNHCIVSMSGNGVSKISLHPLQSSALPFVVIKDGDGNVVKVINGENSTSERIIEIGFELTSEHTIYLNWFDGNTTKDFLNSITVYIIPEVQRTIKSLISSERNYFHSVNKPYVFSGKTANFFGDSITQGFVNGQITEYGYPRIFSDKVGLTHTNYGITGTCIAIDIDVTHPSIYHKLTSVAEWDVDYIFIAGGVNDWQHGVDMSVFRDALEDICTALGTNFDGEVIFITPINQAGWTPVETPVAELQDYRDAITQIAMSHGYSVVQGNLFNFPKSNDTTEFINAMLYDKLHPTQNGYYEYARGLQTVLC